MPRADRLLPLIEALRRRRRPVTAETLAAELGVSVRTLYRDIASLRAQGATVEGEAGVGYVLRPGFTLPPLAFSAEEIEALVLGSRWVAARADGPLGTAAAGALAKIAAVVPPEARVQVDEAGLLVPGVAVEEVALPALRAALRRERKVAIDYSDAAGARTTRTVWPVAIGYFEAARVLVAWCELRGAFRHFRADRIASVALLDARIPRRRAALLAQWRHEHGIPPDDPAGFCQGRRRKAEAS